MLAPAIEPMLAKLAETLPAGEGFLYEPKWDGFRAIVFRSQSGGRTPSPTVYIQSRDLRPLDRYFPELHEYFLDALPDDCVVDGEIVIATSHGLDFDALQLRLHPAASRVAKLAKETPAAFVAFDLLAHDGRDLRDEPQRERRRLLERLLGRVPPPIYLTPMTRDPAVAAEWLSRFEGAGLDGVVVKPAEGRYQPGKRAMIKVKHARTADCVLPPSGSLAPGKSAMVRLTSRLPLTRRPASVLMLRIHPKEGEMRTRRVIFVIAMLLSCVPLWAQSTHPKFKSKEITVGTIAIMPPRVYGTSRKLEAGEVTSRSESLAKEVAEILDEALATLNWDVREPPYAERTLTDVQAGYDRMSRELHDKWKDVNQGRFTLAEASATPEGNRKVDALLFSRVNAAFEQNVSGSRTATTISISITNTSDVRGRFALVDARTGAVLYFFEVTAKGAEGATRQDLLTGVTTQLRKIEPLVIALPPVAVEAPRADARMSDEAKLATWAGEHITILGTEPLHCDVKRAATSGPRTFRRVGAEASAERLPLNTYAGRTGVVLEAKVVGYEEEIVIQVDDGEKLVASNDFGLGFDAELAAAKKLVGTNWWSRGAQTLARPENMCGDFTVQGKDRLQLKRLQQVKIVGVTFGSHLQKLLFTVETEDGKRGVVDGWSGYDVLEERFHLGTGDKPYSARFFLKNPRS